MLPPPAFDGSDLVVVPAQGESAHPPVKGGPDLPKGACAGEKPRQRRRLRGFIDGDELLLPVCVRKARSADSSHWAHSYARKPTEQLPLTEPPPAKPGEEADLWVEQVSNKKDELRARKIAKAAAPLRAVTGPGPEEPLSSDDEPRDYELLSPEESAAKRDIWNEVNKDLLEFWALSRKRQEQKSREAAERRRKREEKQAEAERSCWEAFAARVERAKRPKPRPPPPDPDGELDMSVVDFWQQHNVANSTVLFSAESKQQAHEKEVAREQEAQHEEEASCAREAAEALAASLREEQEEQAKLKRYKKAVDRISDLFGS
eukprot:CAMPEP_0171139284 /NCGR_PEP_ID=MMETSP0766_2-20121228/136598_1 /TAXON_ID=439317 /ORGANISM="Gambierdiscus australes, Strain CAWD 149" /LENGTH=317 /DNA_ID=CAMNT_0011602941 /DNA_START=1 /DNA_END=950 /DNA_ORIENTATION=-